MAIKVIEASLAKLGNDEIYGNGSDGDFIISTDASMIRDMYYKNLTINTGITLTTNGFRVYVKDTLRLNGTIGIKTGTSATTGTVSGTTAVGTSTTNSLGGSAAGATYTASSMSPSVYQWLESLLNGGTKVMPTGVLTVKGGAGGGNGTAGTVTAAVAGSGATNGTAGTAGGLVSRTVGQPGAPGSPGSNGTNGAKGTDVPAAAAGQGNIGGGIVFIAAKVITGSGTIASQGSNATAGGVAANGSGATLGTAGTAGTSSPSAHLSHHQDNSAHYTYPLATDAPTTTVTAPALPTGHQPANFAYEHDTIHRWVHGNHIHHSNHDGHFDHGYMCDGGHGGNFSHNYNHYDYGSTYGASVYLYYYINSIPHTPHQSSSHTGNYNDTGVVFPHCQWVGGYDKNGAAWHKHGSWPRQHYDRTIYYRQTSPTTVKHVGHAPYSGGTGGTAGTKGSDGTNGSTTAGTNGQSGGGGGIICVTDASIPVTITANTSGGTLSSVTGSSGTMVTIINK